MACVLFELWTSVELHCTANAFSSLYSAFAFRVSLVSGADYVERSDDKSCSLMINNLYYAPGTVWLEQHHIINYLSYSINIERLENYIHGSSFQR